jgi:CRP-like cAMP-binding protein/1-acyl-sn-glycerol-3-phosphate acyltransferase
MPEPGAEFTAQDPSLAVLSLLEHSPFFEAFSPDALAKLAGHARRIRVAAGDRILDEGADAERLYMLVSGRVQLGFETTARGRVPVRVVAEPGRVIGWSAMVEPYHYRATATAETEVELLTFERDWLERLAEDVPAFGITLMEQIIAVLGNRLRETRIRLVARSYDEEVVAIRALLDQSAEQLHVTSPLHKIPFYLENRLTIADAFSTLETIEAHGDPIEQGLATLCLEILQRVRTELVVFQHLQTVYEHVAAGGDRSPDDVRRQCCEDFLQLFAHTRYVVRGAEHLPASSGHIFILNHLTPHADHALPNRFRLTLDTHFVSAVLLYRKYGEPPIRVIRKSRPDEYGHQRYYDQLGYIYVYSGHVDEDVQDPRRLAEQRRRLFFEAARSYLLDGKNLVICPEGDVSATEASPRQFRPGAFRLASQVRPEPLIVPIAVANFDKKITKTTLVAVVHEPFCLSHHVPNPISDDRLYAFINRLSETYRSWVAEAVEIGRRSDR